MFLMRSLLAKPSQFPAVAIPAVLLALLMIFVARLLAIWLSLIPVNYAQQETSFLAWMGLHDAVPTLLAIMPILGELNDAQIYFNAAFIIVLVSPLVQGRDQQAGSNSAQTDHAYSRMGEVNKLEVELPDTVNHELIPYRVAEGSTIMQGERIPR